MGSLNLGARFVGRAAAGVVARRRGALGRRGRQHVLLLLSLLILSTLSYNSHPLSIGGPLSQQLHATLPLSSGFASLATRLLLLLLSSPSS